MTLLLRLEGPLQSWGVQSRYGRRDTGLEPSKSGVIGLLCAAQGRGRDADLSDLAPLRMGVRVDRPGTVRSDFHTVGGAGGTEESDYSVATFDGAGRRTVVTTRFYLADASFLVGLEAKAPEQEALLTELDAALAHPVWPLFLGRKAFVPALPVRLPDTPPGGPGLRALALEEALSSYPWPEERDGERGRHGGQSSGNRTERLRMVIENASARSGESRMDVPVSFQPLDRRYQTRYVQTTFLDRPLSATTPAAAEWDREEE